MNLAQTRKSLEERLAVLEERGERIDKHFHNVDREIPKDWDDAAIVRDNDEVVGALDVHTRREIGLIRGALARMDDGSYGQCARCDEPIGAARLEALPEAPYCIRCAEALS